MEENPVRRALMECPNLVDLTDEQIKWLIVVKLRRHAGKDYREFPKTLGQPFGDEPRGDYEQDWESRPRTIEHP